MLTAFEYNARLNTLLGLRDREAIRPLVREALLVDVPSASICKEEKSSKGPTDIQCLNHSCI